MTEIGVLFTVMGPDITVSRLAAEQSAGKLYVQRQTCLCTNSVDCSICYSMLPLLTMND